MKYFKKKSFDIVKNREELSKPCRPCENIAVGEKVGQTLLKKLKESKNGVGLAANQIGINIRVCVVNVEKPIVLVNPKITGQFDKILFQEGCLSFPGDYIITERYTNVAVRADNHPGPLLFSSKNLLECVCVQHEIDHLNGITMYDREAKGEINV